MLRFTNQPIPKEKPVVPFDKAIDMTLLILKGMPYHMFMEYFTASIFSMNDWLKLLDISHQTVGRIKKGRRRFSKLHTEKILQLATLNQIGKKVFPDKNDFSEWLDGDYRQHGKPIPRRLLLLSSFGIYFLMEELKREACII